MAASLWQRSPPQASSEACPNIADILFRGADSVFAVDANQRITFWNHASERFLGISARQALGHPCHELVHGCDTHGRPVCGPACRIARLAKGGAAPEAFPLSLNGDRDPARLWVNIVLAPSPCKGLWTAFHVLHREGTTTGRSASAQPLPRPVRAEHAGNKTEAAPAPACVLTAREQQILRLLAESLPPGAISRRLYISRVTVRNHIQHILAKLQLHSKVEAVAYAYRHHLINVPVHTLSAKGGNDGEESCSTGQG